MTFVAGVKAIYFAYQIIGDRFSGKPNDRYLKCPSLPFNDLVECRDSTHCYGWAGHSAKTGAFSQIRNICNDDKCRAVAAKLPQKGPELDFKIFGSLAANEVIRPSSDCDKVDF